MYFSNYFLQLILLLGTIQGLILSGILFFSRKKRYLNLFLGWIILLVSLVCLNTFFFHADWFQFNRLCQILHAIVPLVLVMPIGPLIYCYTKSVFEPEWKLSGKDWWHFSPVVIDLIPYLTATLYLIGSSLIMIPKNPQPISLFIDTYNTYADLPRWIGLSVYLYLAFKRISAQQVNTPPHYWLRSLLLSFGIFQCIWLAYLIPYLIPQLNISLLDHVGWYPVYIPLVILIYWMGIKGYLISITPVHNEQKSLKPGKSIPADVTRSVLDLLTKAMDQDELYLNPNLNLDMMAKHTGVTAKVISAVLNTHLQTGFNPWVNSYRVTTFQRRIKEEALSHLTLTGVAFECGFNSQASFQRIFKQLTGMVPSQYCNSIKVHR